MTLAEFAEDLEDVLRSLCERPGRWILIAEDVAHHHHFWQALCFEDGSLHVEVVSNYHLEGDDRLTAAQEGLLRVVGWTGPDLPRSTKLVEDGVHDVPGHRWGGPTGCDGATGGVRSR